MGYDVGKEGNVAEEKRTEEISEIKQEPSVSPEDMRYMKEAIRQAKKRQLWEMSLSAVLSSIRTRSLAVAITAVWQTRLCWLMRRFLP